MTSAENAGRHSVATFRQKWIDDLRDTVAEYHSIAMTAETFPYPKEEDRLLSRLGTKIELLLNPTRRSGAGNLNNGVEESESGATAA